VNLRPAAARRLHRAPGTPREAALALGAPGIGTPWAPGRAGRVLAESAAVLDALLAPTRGPG